MKKHARLNHSILFKLTTFVIVIVVVQAALITSILIIGGVLSQGRDNAYEAFSEKVDNRNNYIQREMKNKWTNLDPYMFQISEKLSKSETNKVFFDESIETMIAMLRTTQASGVFVVLSDLSEENHLPGLYIRDYDPLLNDRSNKDLYLLVGPSDIARRLQIPMDQFWKQNLSSEFVNRDFFSMPYNKATLTYNAALLGYWSKPFYLYEDDTPIMTYTMPLFDKSNQLRGVIGVELSLSYLMNFMPAYELQTKDSLGYLIGFKEETQLQFQPMVLTGALQKRMLSGITSLELEVVDEERSIYELIQHNSEDNIYASVKKIGLYQNNTPFENEEWYLIGLIHEHQLLKYVTGIKRLLFVSMMVSIVVGIVSGSLLSIRVTKPILRLARQILGRRNIPITTIETTGLLEVDQLAQAIVLANQEVIESTMKLSRIIDLVEVPIGAFEYSEYRDDVFMTDGFSQVMGISEQEINKISQSKKLFEAFLGEYLSQRVEEEEDIFKITDEKKWIKLKTLTTKESVLGVVIDMSKEMMDKEILKIERDYDPLTKIYNRKAGEHAFEKVVKELENYGIAALVMFDLDSLKQVNDSYGHKYGDLYIQHAVEMLKTIKGEGTTVLNRRSGDEFLLFLYNFPSKESVRNVLDDFYERLKLVKLDTPTGESKPMLISGGLMWLGKNELTYDELIHYADEALYEVKRSNKGTWRENDEV